MMQLTEEQRKALIGLCKIEAKRWKAASDSNPNMRYMVELMEIALTALTAEPDLYRDSQGCFVTKRKGEKLIKAGELVKPLYTTPPVPALRLHDFEEDESAFRDGLNALIDCLEDCGDAEQGLRLALRAMTANAHLNAAAPQPVRVNLTGIMASFPAVGEGIYLEKAGVERAIRQAGGQMEGE
ncbi:hypothetical protein [Pantoea piersonii]|uniref:hypothetical protein n=1 Tax=Pantoea piersonii TaxID=2364647 RepID=UPI00289B985C|nr:hypothetical protein [Pantoea piersonii]